MSDTDAYKPISDAAPSTSDPYPYVSGSEGSGGDAGKALLAGLVGGALSAAGFLVYSRLPDDQKDRLHTQVRQLVESRVNELRSRFNV